MLRVWTAQEAESDLAKGVVVGLGKAGVCNGDSMLEPCPVVLIPLEGRSCGELVQILDGGTRRGQLFGIVR